MSLRVALIGAGWMAEHGHAPSLRRYADDNPDKIELAGIVDLRTERVALFKDRFDFAQGFDDFTLMLERLKPDVCYVLVQFPHVARDVNGCCEASTENGSRAACSNQRSPLGWRGRGSTRLP